MLALASLRSLLACHADAAAPADLGRAAGGVALHLASHAGPSAGGAALQAAGALPRPLQPVLLAAGHCGHAAAARRGSLSACDAALERLGAWSSLGPGPEDPDTAVETTAAAAESLAQAGWLHAAVGVAGALLTRCWGARLLPSAVRMLIVLAEAHTRAGSPAAGLPYALRAHELSGSLGLAVQRGWAAGALADALVAAVGRGAVQLAAKLVRPALLTALAHGPLELQAKLQLVSGRLELIDASTHPRRSALKAWKFLSSAARVFEELKDLRGAREATWGLALAANALGWAAERDANAAAFLDM